MTSTASHHPPFVHQPVAIQQDGGPLGGPPSCWIAICCRKGGVKPEKISVSTLLQTEKMFSVLLTLVSKLPYYVSNSHNSYYHVFILIYLYIFYIFLYIYWFISLLVYWFINSYIYCLAWRRVDTLRLSRFTQPFRQQVAMQHDGGPPGAARRRAGMQPVGEEAM